MTKSFNKFKNTVFSPFLVHFPKFWDIKFFSRKSGSVKHRIWVSSTMPKFSKNWWHNSKKTPGQKDGRKDGHTLFYRTLLATAEGPKRYIMSIGKKLNNINKVSTGTHAYSTFRILLPYYLGCCLTLTIHKLLFCRVCPVPSLKRPCLSLFLRPWHIFPVSLSYISALHFDVLASS